jgi:hypothetical protein
MSTILETSISAEQLHAALRDKTRDLAFGDERMSLFEPLRLEIANAIHGFAARPADGAASPRYDAARIASDQAAALVEAAVPQQHRAALVAGVRNAAAALAAATKAAGPFAGFAGALRLSTAASPVRIVAPRDIALGAAAQDAPPEPEGANYYQKLTNLFPAEGLALYGTGVALYSGANALVVLVSLAVLGVLRWVAYGAGGGDQGARVLAVAAAGVSFLLWATATDPKWLAAFLTVSDTASEQIRHGAAFAGAAAVLLIPLVVRVPTKD